jgi:hypothetical protein
VRGFEFAFLVRVFFSYFTLQKSKDIGKNSYPNNEKFCKLYRRNLQIIFIGSKAIFKITVGFNYLKTPLGLTYRYINTQQEN